MKKKNQARPWESIVSLDKQEETPKCIQQMHLGTAERIIIATGCNMREEKRVWIWKFDEDKKLDSPMILTVGTHEEV